MSLLSQKDREVAIAALEHYAANATAFENFSLNFTHSAFEVNALLSWIRLEYEKNKLVTGA